jgi:predicted ATPase/DNA-binding SARP family transcriptional activator
VFVAGSVVGAVDGHGARGAARHVEIELLGPPGLVGEDGGRRKLAGRQRALLAVLALSAPRAVHADRLLAAVWGEQLPADPANALQQRVSSLRKELDPDRRGDRLLTTGGGYALQVDDEDIDARRFSRLATRANRLLTEGDAAGALDDLDAALGLWKGEPLEGFADEPWAEADARRLFELRLTATEDRHDAALTLGAGGELVASLSELVISHPLRERPAGQLMVALYRDGRQGDALEVYDGTRRRLREELGVDPGPALQAVYRQVLDQDTTLDVTPSTGSGSPALGTRVDNLPASSEPLIGREDTLEEVDRLLDGARLVTLTGPGGTGKTTLAVEVARRRPRPVHGTWLVELAPLTGADGIVGELAATLGVGPGGFGAAGLGVDVLAETLRDRQLLLVLDNCEHLVEPVAALVDEVLGAVAGLRVLATSREPLGVAGEHVVPLPALAVPAPELTDLRLLEATPSVQLLLARARRHDPWFVLTPQDAAAAVELVRRLDGLPLAIELAAAQLRVLSLRELTATLDEQLSSLTSPVRGAPERQRTLRGALDWSWDLLDEQQRSAWAALSVCAGRFGLDTARSLLAAAGVNDRALPVLRGLVDRSLLLAERRAAVTRYRMLETLRTYGREQLERSQVRDPVGAAHAEVVEVALAGCHTSTDQARFGVDLEGLAVWLDEARVALRWAAETDDHVRVQRLAGALGWVWLLRGLATEGVTWLDRGLGAPEQVELETVEPAALLWAAGLRAGVGHAEGLRWAELALEVAREPADRVLAGVFAAVHESHGGRVDACLSRLAEARAEAEQLGGWPLGFCRLISAQLGRLTGRFDQVRQDAEAALALLTDPGLEWARAYAIDNLIDVVVNDPGPDGGAERARELATEGLGLCRDGRVPEIEARLRLQLGRALHELGEVDRGRRHVEEAIQLSATAGRGVGFGFALLTAGSLARQRGELGLAAEQLHAALELLDRPATPFGSVEGNVELALTALEREDAGGAVRHATRAVEIAQEAGAPDLVARALEIAAVATWPEDGALAASVLATAGRLREGAGVPQGPAERRDLVGALSSLRRRGIDPDAAVAAADAAAEPSTVVGELLARHGRIVNRAATGP